MSESPTAQKPYPLTPEMRRNIWPQLYRHYAKFHNEIVETGRDQNFPLSGMLHILRVILSRLELRPTDALLDVGCSNGLFDIALGGLCSQVIATDIVAEQVSLAGKNLGMYDNSQVFTAPSHRLPFGDGAFDKILCCGVIQLVPLEQRAPTFREFWRLLKPGGLAYLHGIPEEAKYRPHLVEGMKLASQPHVDPIFTIMYEQCNLFDKDALLGDMRAMGFLSEAHPLSPADAGASYSFGLVLRKPSA